MFEHVLVGIDGSQSGRDAVALAGRLASPTGSLALIHVRSELSAGRSIALLERQARAAEIEPSLISVREHRPGRGLHQQAEQQGSDLLVIGSCSRTALGRAALGDDTRAALNGATCAVAVAPAGFASQPRPFSRIGVGYDGSAESFNALATARELAAVNGSKIHLLQVVLEPLLAYTNYVGPEVTTTIDDLLQETRDQLVQLPDVETHVMYGAAGEKLAEFSQEVDILVIGSRGYGPLHRLMAGSTCDYLQHHAHCPLLVMPRSATTKPDDVVIIRPKDAPAP